jgi:hypothetical protein
MGAVAAWKWATGFEGVLGISGFSAKVISPLGFTGGLES